MSLAGILSAFLILSMSLDSNTAPQSSSRGVDIFLIGATFVLASIIVTLTVSGSTTIDYCGVCHV